jgi:transposase
MSARFERYRRGTSYQKLADKYGVSKKTMQNAVKWITWRCVDYMPEPPKDDT